MLGLRESLLQVGLGRYNGIFACGLPANNKLDLGYENLQQYSELYQTVIHKLGQLASYYQPDLLLPVPYGSNGYAADIGQHIAVDSVCLSKNPLSQDIHFPGKSRRTINNHHRIVILKDVVNKLTNTNRLLALPGVAERVVAVVSIWDRGMDGDRPPLPPAVGHASIIQEYIPTELEDSSTLWQFAA